MRTIAETHGGSALVNLYASISVDDRRIFLAQNEIRSLEPVAELNPAEPPVAGVGWISFEGRDWPVYNLGNDLRPIDRLPAPRRICILLSADQGYFGLVCDNLEVLSAKRLQPMRLPAIMRLSHTPVQALALYEDVPGCVVSAVHLLAFLDFCAGSGDPSVNPTRLANLHGGSCDA